MKSKTLRQVALILICLVTLTGTSSCSLVKRYVFVNKRIPILPKPDRPNLKPITKEDFNRIPQSLRKRIAVRDQTLKTYAKQLEVAIDTYNDYAKQQNSESGMYSEFGE